MAMSQMFNELRAQLRPWATGCLLALTFHGNVAQAQLITTTSEAGWLASVTDPKRIGFDELPPGTFVANQYAELAFSPFHGGLPVTAAESFPHSLANVLSVDDPSAGGSGGVRLEFAGSRGAAGFWYSDAQFDGSTVGVYGANGQELGSFSLVFPHPTEWQFVGFLASGQDIARIDISLVDGDRVTLDDVQFGSPVPEAGNGSMLVGGGLLLYWLQRRRSRTGGSLRIAPDTAAALGFGSRTHGLVLGDER